MLRAASEREREGECVERAQREEEVEVRLGMENGNGFGFGGALQSRASAVGAVYWQPTQRLPLPLPHTTPPHPPSDASAAYRVSNYFGLVVLLLLLLLLALALMLL